ncbi:TPA: hypothetical protein L4973_004261 [Pseudomonas aeruginosa]|uniref:hypothetical protein n=1 Tax=Pseudomonas aeruginosa TaxID=287 RepID=UPI000F52D69E|nr:hypothetical protein [Pseudomonas aeruginosa]MBN0327902.1 hypothetical protein [Pseudomonas aeruginosa]MBN0368555.1 hypothetical protein [Pseudomonas aeruginosa]MBN0497058.1 hypothetical protein [Pseudomonas aeruginosa]MBN0607360.1 hypothetical protein [Pseudomonas aeruginosa]MBN0621056.1 hypothetical protein [Pseudomonas aeruginosa]
MSKFKSGDLALVVGGDLFLGQQVEVRSWVNPGDLYHVAKDGSHYYLNPESQHSGWSVTDGVQIGVKLERNLMPLKGDFQPEQQKAKEVEA